MWFCLWSVSCQMQWQYVWGLLNFLHCFCLHSFGQNKYKYKFLCRLAGFSHQFPSGFGPPDSSFSPLHPGSCSFARFTVKVTGLATFGALTLHCKKHKQIIPTDYKLKASKKVWAKLLYRLSVVLKGSLASLPKKTGSVTVPHITRTQSLQKSTHSIDTRVSTETHLSSSSYDDERAGGWGRAHTRPCSDRPPRHWWSRPAR